MSLCTSLIWYCRSYGSYSYTVYTLYNNIYKSCAYIIFVQVIDHISYLINGWIHTIAVYIYYVYVICVQISRVGDTTLTGDKIS